MNVLMFSWEYPPHIFGGLGTASYGLVSGMSVQKDLDITLVIPKPYGDESHSFAKIIGACDVPLGANGTGRINFSGGYTNNLFEEVKKYETVAGVLARRLDFDIIHSNDWLTYPAGILAKQISGKPFVIHVHATEFDRSGGDVNPTVYGIEKRGMDEADRIICVSNLTRRIVIERYVQNPDKVVTIHHAVVQIPNVESYKKTLRKDKIITFLGRITMQKGPENFVEVASRIMARTKNIRFVMAGGGDMMNSMIDLVARSGMADRFHFTNFLRGPEYYQMLADSDVYIMPSVSEPFGITPLEAMQMGTPSIISKQSGCAEILTHVIKTNYWDIDAMVDAIYSIIEHPALYKTLRENGRREVKNITWKKVGWKVRDIYNKLGVES